MRRKGILYLALAAGFLAAVPSLLGERKPTGNESVFGQTKARAVLTRVLDRSGWYTDVQFLESAGQKYVQARAVRNERGQRIEANLVIMLPRIVWARSYFNQGMYGLSWNDYGQKTPVGVWGPRLSKSDAEAGAQALRFLALDAQREYDAMMTAKFDEFKQRADTWRQTAIKPEMPEEARRHRVVAEQAIKEKNLAKAVTEYDAALQLFPCWPEGHYNAALIAAELQAYRSAIHHMKCYLELAPDATDARPAKDQLFVWEDKIRPSLVE